ncbi:MAG: oxidoreductase [Aquabacterium sp.]|nr:oxidoreductase [Aquabacterium sp.]MBP7502848.1 oxidoreductase [Aquabacterium sp.]
MFEALQARAAAQGLSLRPPPPEPTSCCGRGCNGCVWEGYYAATTYWRDEALLILAD